MADEETTPPNSPRRRRITTNGASKMIKLHASRDDNHEHHPTTTTATAATPSLNYLAHNKGSTAPSTTNNAPKYDEKEVESTDVSDVITWSNLKESNKSAKIEKFLWNANISNDIGKYDNTLLKDVLIDCTIRFIKSRPIQMRAYQLLQDLTLGTMIQSFYTEEEIPQRFSFKTTIESLKQWKSNEYVTAAAFDYLAALYFRNVTHNYCDSNNELLELAGEAFKNLKRSKAVMRSLIALLAQLFLYLDETVIASAPSVQLIPLIIGILQENSEEKTITYQCCSILSAVSSKCPSSMQFFSENIVHVTLNVLSHHHKNVDICGTIFKILSACAFEEKHVNYILTDQLKEFKFMCQSISMFQSRGDIDVIESVLIVIKRCIHSDCMMEVTKDVRDDIQDAIRTTLTHSQDCADQTRCIQTGSCSITENHVSLCTSIINALSALQVGLNSDQSHYEEISDPGEESEESLPDHEQIPDGGVTTRSDAPSPLNSGSGTPKRRGSETQASDPIAFLKRKDEHQSQVIKILQKEVEDWKNKYEELRRLYEKVLQTAIHTSQESFPLDNSPDKGTKNESVTFHTTVQNKSETSHLSTPEATAPWSPIHMEEEYQEFHELRQNDPLDDPNHSSIPNHDDIGSFSTFDVHDIESNTNFFNGEPPNVSNHQVTKSEIDLIYSEIPKEVAISVSLGVKSAIDYISQSQLKFIQRLQASLAILNIPSMESDTTSKMSLFERYKIDDSIEKELVFVIFQLFRYLHQQLCAASKKAGVGKDGNLYNTIPRSIIRRVLMEYITTIPLKRAPILSDVDIILKTLPLQLNLHHFSFAITVSTCRRFGIKCIPQNDKLLNLFTKFLEALNEYCTTKDIFGLNSPGKSSLSSPEFQFRSPPTVDSYPLTTSDEEVKVYGLKLLEKDDHSLSGIFTLYSQATNHLHLDSMLLFAKDFKICPHLMSTGDLINIYEKVFTTDSANSSSDYYKFKICLIEIAMFCHCFGEESKESTLELGKYRTLIGRISSLLWYMEYSSGYGTMIKRDRSLPITMPFKVDRQVLVLNPATKGMSSKRTTSRKGNRQVISKR